MKNIIIAFCLLLSTSLSFATGSYKEKVMGILEKYAKDYEKDITFTKDVTFGVKVGEDFWHVVAKTGSENSEATVRVKEGLPETPTFFFVTDFETLTQISEGKLNALTASVKAFESDFAPFDADFMAGYQPDQNFLPDFLSLLFHFWTTGSPEIIPFGNNLTRTTHGAQACVFYYQPGFRSAYVSLRKGQHANENEKSRSNPFPTLLIVIKGEGTAIINGKELIVKAGQALLIPAGISHEFINPDHEEPLEAILLMFGDGA